MSGPTLHLALTRPLTSGLTTPAALALVLALGWASSAVAFPKPKYATSLPQSSAPPADTTDVGDSTAPNPSAPKPAPPKAAPSRLAAARPAVVAAAPRPAASTPASAASAGWSLYQVRPGDTLNGVGRRFGANAKTLSDLNELEPKAPLKAGMKLKLPPGTIDRGRDPYATGPSPMTLSDTSAPAPHHAALATTAKTTKPVMKPAVSGAPAGTSATAAARPDPSHLRPLAEETRAAQPYALPAEPGGGALPARSQRTPDPAVPGSGEAWSPKPATATAKLDPVAKAPSEAVTSGRGRFVWPVRGEVVTRFGPLGPGQRNDGVNIAAGEGSPVEAAAAGEVVYAGSSLPGFGNLVLLKHADGWVTAYAHLASISVRMRDHVAQGQTIGVVGQTGGVDRPQLHFEARYAAMPHEKARPVDPLVLLPQ